MRLNRQALTAPGGGGGSGGGGSRRILATTITYTGVPAARVNQITATGVGTLPDPATVLPGGVLQSVQYWVTTAIDYQLALTYSSLGVVNDARVPFLLTTAGVEYTGTHAINITATGTLTNTGLINNRNFAHVVERFGNPVVGSTPSFSLRVGSPNYYLPAGDSFEVTNLNLDATVQVYYVFA